MSDRKRARLLVSALCVTVIGVCVALTVWQVQRRAWKLELIGRIEQRAHASPVPAPGPAQWPAITAASDEYRRVAVSGRWVAARPALVRAVTEHGGGFWVLSPLQREDGAVILINRGFAPGDRPDPARWAPQPGAPASVTGLLRIAEPRGAFLQTNDPAADRWFSRDVAAIAASRGLSAAPYFIDAQRDEAVEDGLTKGLTVLSFSNNHLVYALTWAALAGLGLAGLILVNRRLREAARPPLTA